MDPGTGEEWSQSLSLWKFSEAHSMALQVQWRGRTALLFAFSVSSSACLRTSCIYLNLLSDSVICTVTEMENQTILKSAKKNEKITQIPPSTDKHY